MVTLSIRGKQYTVAEEQASEFHRLFAELKREIAQIPEATGQPSKLDCGYSEPYHSLTEAYFDKMQAVLEGR